MRFCLLCIIICCLYSCTKEETLSSFKQFSTNSSDIFYRVNIDKNDFITIIGGYVWSHGFSISTQKISNIPVKDTFSNKGIFDLLETKSGRLIGVGTDGYFFIKQNNESKWRFERLSEWDILTSIVETENGFMAAGGKAYETGYLYLLNKENSIDTVLRFGHEISELTRIEKDRYIAVGYGNIMLTKDAGLTWEIKPNKGDFYASAIFMDKKIGFLIGYNGTLLKSVDQGETWQKSKSSIIKNGFNSFRKIKKVDANEIIIVGNNGRIWRSLNSGIVWELYKLPTTSDLYDIAKNGRSEYITVGSNGFVAQIEF
jgi:hypothetical protein